MEGKLGMLCRQHAVDGMAELMAIVAISRLAGEVQQHIGGHDGDDAVAIGASIFLVRARIDMAFITTRSASRLTEEKILDRLPIPFERHPG